MNKYLAIDFGASSGRHIIGTLEEGKIVLKEMHRVLKKGGRLLIGDPYVPTIVRPVMNVLTRFSDSGDYHFYGLDEMKKLFVKNGFKLVFSKKTSDHTSFHIAEK